MALVISGVDAARRKEAVCNGNIAVGGYPSHETTVTIAIRAIKTTVELCVTNREVRLLHTSHYAAKSAFTIRGAGKSHR